jgi:hypothetical protein
MRSVDAGAALANGAQKQKSRREPALHSSAESVCYSLASIFEMAAMAASVVMFASVAIVFAAVHLPLA